MEKTAGTARAQTSGHILKVGDQAPEFHLKTDDGKEVSLNDFRGKRVVLFFFPKANTPG
jgi:thioredoxin-dependent peroxiredoxin